MVMGNEIAVFPKDPGISRELALYRVHEPLATKLLKEALKPGMNAIDVGGNIGYYAMMEARLVGPTGKVVAIEPMPDNSEQLCFNVAKNGYDNIDIHKMAIGDHDGTAVMYITARSNWHSLHPPAEAKSEMKVRVSSLDSLVLPYNLPSVDLIRMDLEGYEIVVIEGMKKVLEKYGPRLLVELHPLLVGTPAMEKYLRTLDSMGYGIEWMIEQERDMPLRWHFVKIERPSIRQLMNDPRMWEDPRALTVMFAKNVPSTDAMFEIPSDQRVKASALHSI
jgi:FkbM family methyltransferase